MSGLDENKSTMWILELLVLVNNPPEFEDETSFWGKEFNWTKKYERMTKLKKNWLRSSSVLF
jgi:hypothetical protein